MDQSSHYIYPDPEDSGSNRPSEKQQATNATAHQSGYANIWQPDGLVAYHEAWNGAYYGAVGENYYLGPAAEVNGFGMALPNVGMAQQRNSTYQSSIPQQVAFQQIGPQQVGLQQVNLQQVTSHQPTPQQFVPEHLQVASQQQRPPIVILDKCNKCPALA